MYISIKQLSSILLIITLTNWQNVYGQSNTFADESKNFVILYSDSILYAQNVRVRPAWFRGLSVMADSKRIPLSNVKFINMDEGFFATLNLLPGLAKELLAERVIKGRINIFTERPDHYWDYYGGGFGQHRRYRDRDQGVNMRMYFNKGYETLQRVNYRNLSLAMADDKRSIDLLQGYRKSAKTSTGMYIGAGLTLGASLVSFLVTANRDKPDFDLRNGFSREPKMPSFTASYIMLGAGAGLAIGGYILHLSGLRKLETSVDYYNR